MFYKYLAMGGVAAAVACAAQATPTVIDFEASGTPGAYNALNYPIQGFIFNATMDNIDVGAGSPYTWLGPAHSGNFAGMNNGGGEGAVSFWVQGGTFTFYSLWMRDLLGYGGRSVSLEGWLQGQQVGSASANLAGSAWTHITGNSGFSNVDTVVMRGGNWFMVDDINLEAHVAAVPETQTCAMLLAGLGLVAARTRRRKTEAQG